jgi:hypothetical protein
MHGWPPADPSAVEWTLGAVGSYIVAKEESMTASALVDKSKVIAALRSRNLDERADWVDRELPALIDIQRNSALLKMLGIDIDTVESGDVVTPHS